ncbi:STE50 [Candida pseudojiufengensis]|uniref:STE50 n=1 Tax=Candida pseudojiufengensis TaxID=497109 RepID=UPI002224EE84|nr:STE50 [Candida pseudojiufengensis]KAI5967026.1 STE50 [Candida pseudojiufengensis]
MTTPKSNDSFLKWDPAQVSTYITSLIKDRSVGSTFLDNNIDGSLLPFITTEHLKEIGVQSLRTRLLIKKGINDLVASHYKKYQPQAFNDQEYKLNHININNNHISLEALNLSTVLIQDSIKKFSKELKNQNLGIASPLSPNQSEMKKLNDNFIKLKTDLIPLIRLMKDTKPLPTPTLDPGPASSLDSDEDQNTGLSRSESLYNKSPSSNRFSSGSLLSMGTGKIISQSVSKYSDDKSSSNFKLQKIDVSKSTESTKVRPKLNEYPSAGSTSSVHSPLGKTSQPQIRSPSHTEPLKQLRASTDDSCLKILQQAMKRHHIPRADWSKYVLVICYGDKERILKLAEKPVVVFKELQELGKHPAIMLRQLADTSAAIENADGMFEDSRIGPEIPGGML